MSPKRLISNLKALGFNESAHANDSVVIDNKLFTVRGVNNDKAFESVCLFLFEKIDANRTESELKGQLETFSSAGKKSFVYKVYKWLIEIRERSNLFEQVPLRRSELLCYRGKNLVKNLVTLSKYVMQKEEADCRAEGASASATSLKDEEINTPEYRPALSYPVHNSFGRVSVSPSPPPLSVAPSGDEASINLPSLREYILGDFYPPEMKPLNWYLPLVDDEVRSKPLLLTQDWSPPPCLFESSPPSSSPLPPPSPLPLPSSAPTPARKRRPEEDDEAIDMPPTTKRRLWFS